MSYYNDYCVDCAVYGDDYFLNEDGEWESRCPYCSFNDDDEEDD